MAFNSVGRIRFSFDVSFRAEIEGEHSVDSSGEQAGKKHIAVPIASALAQNYPNPFTVETWIPYEIGQPGNVNIFIHDVGGRLVRTLNLNYQEIGQYFSKDDAAYWDGKNEEGEQVSNGIYFYTIQTGDFTTTKKMVLSALYD